MVGRRELASRGHVQSIPRRPGRRRLGQTRYPACWCVGHEIERKQVSWLWQDRIATGFISIFAGKTGIGKSFVLLDIVARLTTGRTLPGEEIARPVARVLVISEDPKEYVLVPRLMDSAPT